MPVNFGLQLNDKFLYVLCERTSLSRVSGLCNLGEFPSIPCIFFCFWLDYTLLNLKMFKNVKGSYELSLNCTRQTGT